MTAVGQTAAALEIVIASVAARCLKTTGPLDSGTRLELLGLDSLAAIELAAALEVELGRALPADVLLECPDIRALAERLAADQQIHPHSDPFASMHADAVLPADIVPSRPYLPRSGLRGANTILMTGASGFLGGALVEELLNSSKATLVCLARSGATVPAHPRVQVVRGDLAAPRLGLPPEQWSALARSVDAICHCGAAVNWIYSYETLKAANVQGTIELLRLAAEAGASFHFISSLSVCYAANGPREADESFDALPRLRDVHLGYARTKVVAEALVRQAGERGLATRIYRPALISGHSVTGAYTRDDLIAALVRGCIAMGAAPDLDWKLDCVPVDHVAKAIVELSARDGSVFHLGHRRPRHWRECVLWMRMAGYDVKLISYPAWLRQLDRETRAAGPSTHPLRPLRTFFLDRLPAAGGLTMPELYEERRRTRARSDWTHSQIGESHCPPLDAALLDTYFEAFRQSGDLAAPRRAHAHVAATNVDPLSPHVLTRAIGREVTDVKLLSSGSDHSIVSELTAWRARRITGLFKARLTFSDGATQTVMIKVKAVDADVVAVGEALAGLVHAPAATAYSRWRERIGFAACHRREIALYQQRDDRFTRHVPAVLGTLSDEETGLWLIILEHVDDASIIDAADRVRWTGAQIEAALDGLASLHALWLGRERELRQQSWIGYVQATDSVAEMADLWMALADHAEPLFAGCAGGDMPSIHRAVINSVRQWWPALETGPRTLIHHDFNPRNVCLRGAANTLCAYDWELATIGAPQRDLAEFLCFVLPVDASRHEVAHWSAHHRRALETHSGTGIDAALWDAGLTAALNDLLINRLSIYAMVHRVRPQSFLPRVIRSWRNIHQQHALREAA